MVHNVNITPPAGGSSATPSLDITHTRHPLAVPLNSQPPLSSRVYISRCKVELRPHTAESVAKACGSIATCALCDTKCSCARRSPRAHLALLPLLTLLPQHQCLERRDPSLTEGIYRQVTPSRSRAQRLNTQSLPAPPQARRQKAKPASLHLFTPVKSKDARNKFTKKATYSLPCSGSRQPVAFQEHKSTEDPQESTPAPDRPQIAL